MKPGRAFWGTAFLVVGIVLTLDRVAGVDLHLSLSLKFWPLLLILWGAGLVIGTRLSRLVAAAVGGGLFAVLLLSGLWGFHGGDYDGDPSGISSQVFHEELNPSVTRASFSLESSGGTIALRDTASEFMVAETRALGGRYSVDRSHGSDRESVTLRYEGVRRGWGLFGRRNDVGVRLNSAPVWDLRFDVGATDLNIDATPFRVEHVWLNAGAANLSIKLGDRFDTTMVTISTGASTVKILVPATSACEIDVSSPLSLKDFKGFERVSKGVYRTANYSESTKRVSFDVSAGASRITVVRY